MQKRKPQQYNTKTETTTQKQKPLHKDKNHYTKTETTIVQHKNRNHYTKTETTIVQHKNRNHNILLDDLFLYYTCSLNWNNYFIIVATHRYIILFLFQIDVSAFLVFFILIISICSVSCSYNISGCHRKRWLYVSQYIYIQLTRYDSLQDFTESWRFY